MLQFFAALTVLSVGYGNKEMKYFDYHLFSGIGWLASVSLSIARPIYQLILTREGYLAAFGAQSVIVVQFISLIFFVWLVIQSYHGKHSKVDFACILFAASVNFVAHCCSSHMVVDIICPCAAIQMLGALTAVLLCCPQKFCAGWVVSQLDSESSHLRQCICWKPQGEAWKPAYYFDWAISYYISAWPSMYSLCVFMGTHAAIAVSILVNPVSAESNGLILVLLSIAANHGGLHLTLNDLKYFNMDAHKNLKFESMEYRQTQVTEDSLNDILPQFIVDGMNSLNPVALEKEVPCVDFVIDNSTAKASKKMHLVSAFWAASLYVAYIWVHYFSSRSDELSIVKLILALMTSGSFFGFALFQKWILEWALFNLVGIYWFVSATTMPFIPGFILAYTLALVFSYDLGVLMGSNAMSMKSLIPKCQALLLLLLTEVGVSRA